MATCTMSFSCHLFALHKTFHPLPFSSCWRPAFALALFLHGAFAYAAPGVTVVYPASEMADDVRFDDLTEILRTALKKTVPEYGPYILKSSGVRMNEARYLAQLRAGEIVNVMWSSTSVEKEKEFLTIRIPLRKGILGFRVALIAKNKQARIDEVKTVEDLRRLSVGQGVGWGDVKLYQENGIPVGQADYDSLFKMTAAGRFDLFPRGIGEIFPEYARYAAGNPDLRIEKNLLIYYPWPYYFFFNRRDAALRDRVEAGLRKMLADGSFDAIFWKYNGKAIEEANLKGRRVIRLKNDLLPKETPLDNPALWFDPGK